MSATDLERSTPEEQGVFSRSILNLINDLEISGVEMHSLMLVRHGRVIAEGWWKPYRPEYRQYVYSMSKSFTSSGVGLAVSDGLLSVDDPVISFFPTELPTRISDNLAALRVRDLLTMTSGHEFDTLVAALVPGQEHWARTILSFPVGRQPGTFFLYNSGATYLLSAIVHKVTGKPFLAYLDERLFQPLGIRDAAWDACPQGVSCGGWGLSIRTEDVARFGLLYLQEGTWNGSVVLPWEWIKEATTFARPGLTENNQDGGTDWRQGYGYQFWGCRHAAYRADGAFGQFCVVMPEQDAVIAVTSQTQTMQGILDRLWKHLLPALQPGPLQPDQSAQKALLTKLASLELPPLRGTAASKPGSVMRRVYRLEENGLGLHTLILDFDPSGCSFCLEDAHGQHTIRCGDGEWVENETRVPGMQPTLFSHLHDREKKPLPVAASGAWLDDSTYRMRWQYLETPHDDRVTCRFQDGEVELSFQTQFGDLEGVVLAGVQKVFRGKEIG